MRKIAGIEPYPAGGASVSAVRRRTGLVRCAGLVGLLLVSSWPFVSCDRATEPRYGSGPGEHASIAYLKSLCSDRTVRIAEELTVEGIVTANDIRGEFPRRLMVEDATAGIGIEMDHTDLSDLYPLGARVVVHCSGLALGEYGGKVQLGAPPTGNYGVDRIARADIPRHVRCTELNARERRPRTMLIGELRPADADTYVRFTGVHFREAGAPWCASDSVSGEPVTTFRTLVDASGAELTVRVLPSCHYAMEPVPQGTGSVNGIVDYFDGAISLRIVNYEIDLELSAAVPPTASPSAVGY